MKNCILPVCLSLLFLLCLVTPIFGAGKCIQCFSAKECAAAPSIDCTTIAADFALPADLGDMAAKLEPIKPVAEATECVTITQKDKPDFEVRMCGITEAACPKIEAEADLVCKGCAIADEPCNAPAAKGTEPPAAADASGATSIALNLSIFFIAFSTALVKFVF